MEAILCSMHSTTESEGGARRATLVPNVLSILRHHGTFFLVLPLFVDEVLSLVRKKTVFDEGDVKVRVCVHHGGGVASLGTKRGVGNARRHSRFLVAEY